MLVKLQKQVAIVEKIKVIFNKNTTIIKSSRQDQKVKVLIIFCLSLSVINNWTLILACFDFSCMIHANCSIELKHLIWRQIFVTDLWSLNDLKMSEQKKHSLFYFSEDDNSGLYTPRQKGGGGWCFQSGRVYSLWTACTDKILEVDKQHQCFEPPPGSRVKYFNRDWWKMRLSDPWRP